MYSQQVKCKIAGIGAWGSGFENWHSLQEILKSDTLPDKNLKGPKPSIIPANERRRAPLPVRLAVESSLQATQDANISPASLSSVFVSALGDTDLTDYMCKTLASEFKELSPTKFHNSVHNAPAGYWTISTNSMENANAIAGFENSVSLALLEAVLQLNEDNTPVLVTFYDAPVTPTLRPLLKNSEAFAFSIVLVPTTAQLQGFELGFSVHSHASSEWPSLNTSNVYLNDLYKVNPSAKVLVLAELLINNQITEESLILPLSKASSLVLSLK